MSAPDGAASGAVVLDWSAARSVPGICIDCGQPSSLLDPLTGKPRHKPCAERVAEPSAVASADGAALGPERAAKRSDSVRYRPEGYPYSHARHMDVLAAWPPEPIRLRQPQMVAHDEPAVAEPEVEHLVPMRPLQDGDPCPKGVHTVRAALERAGWGVQAVYACVRREGVPVHSVSLRCSRRGVRAWAVWVDGKATGGQVQGHRGTLGITAWRAATGSAPVPKAPRRTPSVDTPPVVDLRPMDAPSQDPLL